jgi:hypothetical protein
MEDNNSTAEEKLNKEIDDYMKETSPCLTPGEFDPLEWWSLKTEKFPLMADIAKRIFVIPASSSECERHFSAFNARHIITGQRNSMHPETVEAISIVLEGYKNNLIK